MPIQNHVHLDTTLGGTPEFAPTATYKVLQEHPEDQIYVQFDRALDGTPHWGILENTSGPLVFLNMGLTIRCSYSEYKTLRGLLGKQVKFVENDHCDDDSDHTSYIRTMLLDGVRYRSATSPMKINCIVEIHLTDLSTVAATR